MKEPVFYQDPKTGEILEKICCKDVSECCGGLQKITPNTSDGASEKHLPVVECSGCKVTARVGSVFHPMEDKHSIQWVVLQTEKGCQRRELCPDSEPVAVFALTEDDRPVAAYAYCNLHGLWKTEV